uniref:Uncharacterized protein n=1 Tax=Ciona intestinalis TaxID=7719 RepID=H2XXI6_CIOIN
MHRILNHSPLFDHVQNLYILIRITCSRVG